MSDPTSADGTDPDFALVMRAYRAFARGDIGAAVIDLDPEVEWIEPDEFPNGGRRQGPAAVVEYLTASRAMWADLAAGPRNRVERNRRWSGCLSPRDPRAARFLAAASVRSSL